MNKCTEWTKTGFLIKGIEPLGSWLLKSFWGWRRRKQLKEKEKQFHDMDLKHRVSSLHDNRKHTQHWEMIARQEPRCDVPQSSPSKTCSGVISSTWAGHLMEESLDAQLQVPYNRWTRITSMIVSPRCQLLSPPCLICFSPSNVLKIFFFTYLIYCFIRAFWRCGYLILSCRVCESGTESSRTSKDPSGLPLLM